MLKIGRFGEVGKENLKSFHASFAAELNSIIILAFRCSFGVGRGNFSSRKIESDRLSRRDEEEENICRPHVTNLTCPDTTHVWDTHELFHPAGNESLIYCLFSLRPSLPWIRRTGPNVSVIPPMIDWKTVNLPLTINPTDCAVKSQFRDDTETCAKRSATQWHGLQAEDCLTLRRFA